MFAAQAIARDMIAAGRGDEVETIRQPISAGVLEPPDDPPNIPAQNAT